MFGHILIISYLIWLGYKPEWLNCQDDFFSHLFRPAKEAASTIVWLLSLISWCYSSFYRCSHRVKRTKFAEFCLRCRICIFTFFLSVPRRNQTRNGQLVEKWAKKFFLISGQLNEILSLEDTESRLLVEKSWQKNQKSMLVGVFRRHCELLNSTVVLRQGSLTFLLNISIVIGLRR